MTNYKCPNCGITISRRNLIVDSEKKTEILQIRMTPSTMKKWNDYLADIRVPSAEDGLLVAIGHEDLDIQLGIKAQQ